MEEKKKRRRPSLTAYRALEKAVNELRVENESLKSSNGYMENELDRLRNKIECIEKENDRLRSEMFQMEKRGFWSRVFNR